MSYLLLLQNGLLLRLRLLLLRMLKIHLVLLLHLCLGDAHLRRLLTQRQSGGT